MLTRRGFLKLAGALTAVALGMGCAEKKPEEPRAATVATPTPTPQLELPWPYVKLDPAVVGEKAYEKYYEHHCMFGVFDAIVDKLREKVGYPYTTFPSEMMVYGKGGVAGWATLCGALNGAAAAIYLVSNDPDPIINELYQWYCQEELPDFRPKNPKFEIPKSVSGSPLCHVSVTNWCKATGFKAFSKERSERCAWITASVAAKTVELLNAQADGTFVPAYPLPDRVKQCRGCHDKGSALENTRGKMDCTQCHFNLGEEHPKFG
ncbi:C-GCAxxG-C-C family (seleno)protein [Archaeoglobus veneficus]|uniref:Split soret cytochrome c n=1 Tax=Archaeoglobus veneficus (strain DSM 11195 / SNP6) TaxID=693661 RepID=F2KR97_ARCVS|nr:C-GCAxxG-C-C family (seleno)protein [Archaeoglobus veneficus]AEA47831.1 hypothetical protein Arcve_1835 [Archaeoglobus veneficus SNP6]